MRTRSVAALVLAAATLLRPGILWATTAADVCPPDADPCELTHEITVTAGSALDFGARAFVIKSPSGRLQIDTGDTLSITAGRMAIETGPGGRLRTAPGSDGGCTVNVETTGNFDVVRVTGSSIAVDLSSSDALCELRVTAGGDVAIDADIRARGTGIGDGGSVFITAAGHVTTTGSIEADGAGAGGSVEIAATGPIDLQGTTIDVSSSEVGFGTIALETAADLTIGTKLDLKGKGLCADGGLLFLSATGSITITDTGSIDANGSGSPQFGGCFGAEMSINAGGSIIVNGPIDASGGAPDGAGGFLEDVTAGVDFLQNAPILMQGNGPFGVGGEVTISAARTLRLGALFDLNGGAQGGGGILRVEGGERVEVAGEVRADGADFGSLTFATAAESTPQVSGRIVVSGNVHARSALPAYTGDIRLEACEIEVASAGRIETSGQTSRNLLRASDTMTIAGTLLAGAGVNELQHRDPARPPILTGSTITPSPIITSTPTIDPELRPCACTLAADAPGLLCDDGNPCTQELCDLALGCVSSPLAGEGIAGCDDGNVCDGRETCAALACTAGTPPLADDGDPCTDDGTCDPLVGYTRTAKIGFAAATCRMDRVELALGGAAPGDISVKAGKKVANLARAIRTLVEQADGAAGKRRGRLLRAAAKKLKKLERLIAAPKSRIAANLAQQLTLETTETRATLSSLTTAP